MREIETVTGRKLKTGCISCSIASGELEHPGSICRYEFFDVHQDVEIALPGFIIVSSIRHIASVREFTALEEREFSTIIPRVRKAQYQCGLQNAYLFQNEDTSDHFHLWLFPVYEWMRSFGKGAALLAGAMSELKHGRYSYHSEEVFRMVTLLRSCLQADYDWHSGASSHKA